MWMTLAGMQFASAAQKLYIYDDGEYYENAYYSMQVPDGYTVDLPLVTDAEGNPVSVTWAITWQAKGQGNPNSTAFKLVSGKKIKCTWAYGSCEVTATAKDGAKIRINVDGFRLAKQIRFREDSYTVKQGHRVQTEITVTEMGYLPGEITWKVGDPTIIQFDERLPQTGMPTVTGLKPGTTTLTATLINGAKATCTITVLDVRMPGDVDESGHVVMYDAELLYWYVAGDNYTINRVNSDVNADGRVDIHDVLLLFQHEAGWDVTLQ